MRILPGTGTKTNQQYLDVNLEVKGRNQMSQMIQFKLTVTSPELNPAHQFFYGTLEEMAIDWRTYKIKVEGDPAREIPPDPAYANARILPTQIRETVVYEDLLHDALKRLAERQKAAANRLASL